jgi:hypothetical protein
MTAKRRRSKKPQSTVGHPKQPVAVRATAKKPAPANEIDATADSQPLSRLRGLLPTPPEVEELVARELAERPMSDTARQWVTDGFKLQYYFGGQVIAYRNTRQGKEVLAVGMDEIGRLMRDLPGGESKSIVIGHPEPW